MKQYLLSIYQPDVGTPPPEFLEKVMRDVNTLVQETKSAGVWVFNGGLHPPSTATVVRCRDRRPVCRGQRAHRRVPDHQGAGPGLRARVGPQDRAGDHAPDRGPTVSGRGGIETELEMGIEVEI